MENSLRLGVIEANWFEGKHISVKPLFDIISNIHGMHSNSYFYSMFNCSEALKAAIGSAYFSDCERIYIAAHGDFKGNIGGDSSETTSRTKLKRMLIDTNKSKKFKGLYMGCCEVGNIDFVRFILGLKLKNTESSRFQWVAGYEESVDWINSSAVDMLF